MMIQDKMFKLVPHELIKTPQFRDKVEKHSIVYRWGTCIGDIFIIWVLKAVVPTVIIYLLSDVLRQLCCVGAHLLLWHKQRQPQHSTPVASFRTCPLVLFDKQ